MELFRITKTEYQDDLTGIGAFYHGGRWNSPRNAMLYTSSHRSLAMLEVLVHWNKTIPPPDYVIVVLFVPDAKAHSTSPYLLPEWHENQQWSKEVGDDWLKTGKDMLLRVPSVLAKSEYNYLINPLHADAASVKIIDVEPFTFDNRLFFFK
jgi:RES domain-containing protein